jgi:hypothetical protein
MCGLIQSAEEREVRPDKGHVRKEYTGDLGLKANGVARTEIFGATGRRFVNDEADGLRPAGIYDFLSTNNGIFQSSDEEPGLPEASVAERVRRGRQRDLPSDRFVRVVLAGNTDDAELLDLREYVDLCAGAIGGEPFTRLGRDEFIPTILRGRSRVFG